MHMVVVMMLFAIEWVSSAHYGVESVSQKLHSSRRHSTQRLWIGISFDVRPANPRLTLLFPPLVISAMDVDTIISVIVHCTRTSVSLQVFRNPQARIRRLLKLKLNFRLLCSSSADMGDFRHHLRGAAQGRKIGITHDDG